MKRILSILFLFFSFYFLASTVIFADFDSAYQSYLSQYDQYRLALSNYQTAKNRYLTYQTLNSQSEALNNTKIFLQIRDQTLILYLKLLLEKNPDENYLKLLNEDLSFYQDHLNTISAVGNLTDAVFASERTKQHFSQTEALSRQTVVNILLNKLKNMNANQNKIASGFEEKINSLKNQGKNVTTLERWILSFKGKQLLTNQKIGEVQILSDKLEPKSSDQLSRDFSKIQTVIYDANQYLKEGTSFLVEIEKELKYGNY